MIKRIIILILLTLLFYAVGRLAYEYFYRLTISIVKMFSTVPLSFFGKFPFWFFGDPTFGLIIASIPLTVFSTNMLSQDYKKTLIIYSLCFIMTYLLTCWVTSIGFLASNDFYKKGQELSYNLREVNLNGIFLETITIATLVTTISLLTMKLIFKFKTHKKDK